MKTICVLLVAALALVPVASPNARDLSVEFQDGLVTIHAVEATVPEILTEWARQGRTRIVGAESVVAPPVTLELIRVPERQALDTLLRSVAGYVVGVRPVDMTKPATRHESTFDRIDILALSTVHSNPPIPGSDAPVVVQVLDGVDVVGVRLVSPAPSSTTSSDAAPSSDKSSEAAPKRLQGPPGELPAVISEPPPPRVGLAPGSPAAIHEPPPPRLR
jgi:hypothetical protein